MCAQLVHLNIVLSDAHRAKSTFAAPNLSVKLVWCYKNRGNTSCDTIPCTTSVQKLTARHALQTLFAILDIFKINH